MPEVVSCPTCGAAAEASAPGTIAVGTRALRALSGEAAAERIAQFREVVRLQKEQLDAARDRIRALEEMLRFREDTGRPGIHPPPPSTRPAVRPEPFQGRARSF